MDSGTCERATFASLVEEIRAIPAAVRLVAVDGPGGSGKSTFARRLARWAGDAPVVPTDDFASWEHPIDWWPRLLAQVVLPLVSGLPGRYQRYDWAESRLAEWVTVPVAPIVVIEGVSSGRREWSEHLSYVVWIETDRDRRLRRGLDRDGEEAREQWLEWKAAEDRHFDADPTRSRASIVVDGAPTAELDPDVEVVILDRPLRSVRPRTPGAST